MTTWCWWEGSTSPRWRVSGSMSACVLWFGEEEGHSLAHRGTDYYLVREESCAEQDVPRIVLFYSVLQNPHKNPCLIHYNVPPRPTPPFFL